MMAVVMEVVFSGTKGGVGADTVVVARLLDKCINKVYKQGLYNVSF